MNKYIITNIDEVSKEFHTSAELIHHIRNVAVENNDEDIAITDVGEALSYLAVYCPNLNFDIQ